MPIRYDPAAYSPEHLTRITLSDRSRDRGLAGVVIPAWLSSLGNIERMLYKDRSANLAMLAVLAVGTLVAIFFTFAFSSYSVFILWVAVAIVYVSIFGFLDRSASKNKQEDIKISDDHAA